MRKGLQVSLHSRHFVKDFDFLSFSLEESVNLTMFATASVSQASGKKNKKI